MGWRESLLQEHSGETC